MPTKRSNLVVLLIFLIALSTPEATSAITRRRGLLRGFAQRFLGPRKVSKGVDPIASTTPNLNLEQVLFNNQKHEKAVAFSSSEEATVTSLHAPSRRLLEDDDATTAKDACEIECDEPPEPAEDNFVNYEYFYKCDMVETQGLAIFLLVTLLIYLFLLVASTADEFIVPNLTELKDIIGLNENVAGVTLLALANGAPDLFTAVAAFSTGEEDECDDEDSDLGVGTVLGTGIFIVLPVLASIILFAPFKADRRPFARDIIFYIMAVGLFWVFYNDGVVHTWEAILMMGLYVVYVLVVVVGRYIYQTHMKPKKAGINMNSPSYQYREETPRAGGEAGGEEAGEGGDEKMKREDAEGVVNVMTKDLGYHLITDALTKKTKKEDTVRNYVDGRIKDALDEDALSASFSEGSRSRRTTSVRSVERKHSVHEADKSSEDYAKDRPENLSVGYICESLKSVVITDEWEEKNLLGKFLLIIESPFTYLRLLSIPIPTDEAWNKFYCWVSLVLFPIVIDGFCIRFEHTIATVVCLVLSGVGLVAGYFLNTKSPPSTATLVGKIMRFFLSILGGVMACVWTFVLCNEIVEILKLIGDTAGVSPGIMGITVLSWGNSIGDLVADIAMARDGFPRMAAGGTVGGALFNLLIGGGLGFLLASLEAKGAGFQLSPAPSAQLSFAYLIGSLGLLLVYGVFTQFDMKRPLGIMMVISYLVYLVLCILLSVDPPILTINWFGK